MRKQPSQPQEGGRHPSPGLYEKGEGGLGAPLREGGRGVPHPPLWPLLVIGDKHRGGGGGGAYHPECLDRSGGICQRFTPGGRTPGGGVARIGTPPSWFKKEETPLQNKATTPVTFSVGSEGVRGCSPGAGRVGRGGKTHTHPPPAFRGGYRHLKESLGRGGTCRRGRRRPHRGGGSWGATRTARRRATGAAGIFPNHHNFISKCEDMIPSDNYFRSFIFLYFCFSRQTFHGCTFHQR